MAKLSILTDRCKGCGLCVAYCPKKILTLNSEELNSSGYTPVTVTDMAACIASVSYTHLDVYKKQHASSSITARAMKKCM